MSAAMKRVGGRKIIAADLPAAALSLEYYSLDVIISVGYRVKSKRGTQFRIWANKVLKDYLIKGYAINENLLREKEQQLTDLKQTVKLLENVLQKKSLNSEEAIYLTEKRSSSPNRR